MTLDTITVPAPGPNTDGKAGIWCSGGHVFMNPKGVGTEWICAHGCGAKVSLDQDVTEREHTKVDEATATLMNSECQKKDEPLGYGYWDRKR